MEGWMDWSVTMGVVFNTKRKNQGREVRERKKKEFLSMSTGEGGRLWIIIFILQ